MNNESTNVTDLANERAVLRDPPTARDKARFELALHVIQQCPSANPDMEGAKLFGVIGGTVDAPRMIHMAEPLPVTDELLALSGPVNPTEVFRFTATCAGTQCQHFDGHDCSLATRIVQLMPPVTAELPVCSIRTTCRWWLQEGAAACYRCPQIVSNSYNASETMVRAADPKTPVLRVNG